MVAALVRLGPGVPGVPLVPVVVGPQSEINQTLHDDKLEPEAAKLHTVLNSEVGIAHVQYVLGYFRCSPLTPLSVPLAPSSRSEGAMNGEREREVVGELVGRAAAQGVG